MFQFPEIQLFEETVFDDVAFGPRNLGVSKDEIENRVRHSLSLVGLDFERFRNLSPFQLSGGEKRRVAIAGILAMEPQVLVLDEPTVGLDTRSASMVEDVIRSYHRIGKTIVFISHDMDFVARLAERIIVLKNGLVHFEGSKRDLFQDETVLKQADLGLPHICQFMHQVKSKGYPVRTDVFTIDDAKSELMRLREKKDASDDDPPI